MRTRPDAQQETLTRRLALVRPESAAVRDPQQPRELQDPDESVWWAAHATATGWTDTTQQLGEGDGSGGAGGAMAPMAAPVIRQLPEPGRHAARRPLALLSRLPRVPEALQGRARLGTGHLAVVALVLVAALAVTCWWLARGRATDLTPVSAPAASASPLVPLATPGAGPGQEAGTGTVTIASPGGTPGTTGTTAATGTMVTVDVEGKVRHPGIVIVPSGSRVTDALQAAGGVPNRRFLHGLNLAAVLTDGQQIVVGAPVAPGAGPGVAMGGTTSAGGAVGTGAAGAPGALVNLNSADAEQLDTLPGVGPVTAQAILEWREQNGGFTSVQELLEVDGIGPATLEKLTPHVTI